ncbi:MAG: dTDP-4-dehydrorhamnose reductase [Thermodesulfobacteriota bacterium]
MRILVTGANGQLGWELVRRGPARGQEIIGLTRTDLDVADRGQILTAVGKSGAALVINAAAYTAVDKAESEPEKALAANGDAPGWLAEACGRENIPLIHVSTDYVFDGRKQGPYLETDPVSPLGIYGRSKAEGEARVRSALARHIIVRTAWVYGRHGHNFVRTILRLAQEREALKVVADQYGCPTNAADLAEALLVMAAKLDSGLEAWGTYHYCGGGRTTWHGLAVKAVELAWTRLPIKAREVIPITTAEYPLASPRPANSVLDCGRTAEVFGLVPPAWPESLARLLDEALPEWFPGAA